MENGDNMDMYTRVKRQRRKIKRDMYGMPLVDQEEEKSTEDEEETEEEEEEDGEEEEEVCVCLAVPGHPGPCS